MFSRNFLEKLKPEVIYLHGDSIVPAKDLSWKRDSRTGKIIEKVRPNTHKFENILKQDIKNELKDVDQFPTDKEIFIILSYGLHSSHEYKKHDLDNRAKTILDALKGPVYSDDSQVKILFTYKELLDNSQESYYRFSIKILNKTISNKIIKETKKIQCITER